ncbi:MAG: hypothetical protein QOE35_2280 [Actinomycetota bacterium]|jgi:hypothetical protein
MVESVRLGGRSYLVECYSPGVQRDDVESAATRAGMACRELSDRGTAIEYSGALLLPTDEVVMHLFTSASEDAVRDASERADLPFERILETVAVPSGDDVGLDGEGS